MFSSVGARKGKREQGELPIGSNAACERGNFPGLAASTKDPAGHQHQDTRATTTPLPPPTSIYTSNPAARQFDSLLSRAIESSLVHTARLQISQCLLPQG